MYQRRGIGRTSFRDGSCGWRAAALIVEKEVEVPGDVTVIRVEDTRYALALMSAAYFGYPANKLKIIGITGQREDDNNLYDPVADPRRGRTQGRTDRNDRGDHRREMISLRQIRRRNLTRSRNILPRWWKPDDTVVMEVSSSGADAEPDSRHSV